MIALARESVHSAMPVQHWIFSWQEGEQPTREQVEEVVDMFLEKTGLAELQIIYGLYYDTDNYHLHIAVNRMNPESGKVVQPHRGFDIRKALELSKAIDREYAEAAHNQRERPCVIPSGRPGEPSRAYYAHFDNIRRHLSIEDYSRVDAMIALRMRANGHSREAVEETIRVCAPTIREEQAKGRSWQRYAKRTAEYAFGMAGDRDLMRNERYRELWLKVERKEEKLGEVKRIKMR